MSSSPDGAGSDFCPEIIDELLVSADSIIENESQCCKDLVGSHPLRIWASSMRSRQSRQKWICKIRKMLANVHDSRKYRVRALARGASIRGCEISNWFQCAMRRSVSSVSDWSHPRRRGQSSVEAVAALHVAVRIRSVQRFTLRTFVWLD